MAFFEYKAVTADGKIIEGTLEAADERTAAARLGEQGQFPIKLVSPDSSSLLGRQIALPWQRKKVHQKDLLVFTQELSTLIRAGLPLDRSLSILSQLTVNVYLREIVQDLKPRRRASAR